MANKPNEQILYGVPSPISTESLASWITRAAFSQGCAAHDIQELFGIYANDVEIFTAIYETDDIATQCNIAPESFQFHKRVMTNLQRIDLNGHKFLLRKAKREFSRYCLLCLKSDPIPYFRLEWRFIPWRWCPLHNCLLDEVCPQCSNTLSLPFNLLSLATKHPNAWNLSYCPTCGESLTEHEPTLIDLFHMPSAQRRSLINGRALMAALDQGVFQTRNEKVISPIDELSSIRTEGMALRKILGLTNASSHLNKQESYL